MSKSTNANDEWKKYENELEKSESIITKKEFISSFQAKLSFLSDMHHLDEQEQQQPQGLAHSVKLRDYQVQGVSWLSWLYENKIGGILGNFI